MKFAFPEYWVWMLGVPVSLGILFLVYKRVSQISATWFSPDQYARSYPFTKFTLRALGFLMLFMALIGPYWSTSEQQINILGREIYILLDVSGSMNCRDVQPSRLERAKQELKKVISHLKGDKIGLILFTESAYVQCPLTPDHEAVKLFIDLAKTDQYAQTGTQFRRALTRALERFRNTPQVDEKVSRAIILISDGEDFGDSYASLIERLKRSNVKVFPVGVGTYAGGPIPESADDENNFKRRKDGTMVVSRLIDENLKEIAQTFGTEYLRISQPTDDLVALETQIYNMTASPLEASIEQVENNRFQAVLFIAVLLLLASLFLMPIRKV